VHLPVLAEADQACSARDPSNFAGVPAIRAFAEQLAACAADRNRRRSGGTPPTKRATELTDVGMLERDFAATLRAGAARATRQRTQCRFGTYARGWMAGRREEVDFQTLGAGGRHLPIDGMLPPQSADRLEPLDRRPKDPPVQPLTNRLLRELWARSPGTTADNYPDHGGGSFKNRGFSLDLRIGGPLDDRGFYPRDRAVAMLLALDAAASAVGATWRVLYNDFAVAAAVNRHTGLRQVVFMGQVRPNGTNLNWHGPLILHFHLDVAPLPR